MHGGLRRQGAGTDKEAGPGRVRVFPGQDLPGGFPRAPSTEHGSPGTSGSRRGREALFVIRCRQWGYLPERGYSSGKAGPPQWHLYVRGDVLAVDR